MYYIDWITLFESKRHNIMIAINLPVYECLEYCHNLALLGTCDCEGPTLQIMTC